MPHTFHLDDYSVFIGNLRDTFPAWLRANVYSKVVLLSDTNTRTHCLPAFLEKTGLPADLQVLEIAAGEPFKNLDTCRQIWQSMLDAQLDRKALVVNLGGGVIGDMGGFCAATWKRGVDFVQVPTTLLSMTDAAIGGKLGIDFQGIKNTVGVFRNPAAVFVEPDFLSTLPDRELRSGFAEVIKHALIGDPDLWEKVQNEAMAPLSARTAGVWFDVLRASIAVKVRVVQEDPLEKGIRALLNYGHTVGHAVESYFLETEAPLTHGEAIAIGMICESRIVADAMLDDIIRTVQRHYAHRPVPEAAFPAIWELMQQDKKNAAGKVRMAVPAGSPFAMKLYEPLPDEVTAGLLFYNALK